MTYGLLSVTSISSETSACLDECFAAFVGFVQSVYCFLCDVAFVRSEASRESFWNMEQFVYYDFFLVFLAKLVISLSDYLNQVSRLSLYF